MTRTYQQASIEFLQESESIDTVLCNAVAHKKKLQFAASQFRSFSQAYSSEHDSNTEKMTNEESDAVDQIESYIQSLKLLIAQNQRNSWAQLAINSSATSVASFICEIVQNLKEATKVIDPNNSKIFDARTPNWLAFHLRDLHSISTSFQNFIQKQKAQPNEDQSVKMILISIDSRIQSIDGFINEYEDDAERETLDLLAKDRIFSPIPIHYFNWKLEQDDFEADSQIGKGVSARVFKGKMKATGELVAIKQFVYKDLGGNRFRSYQREISVMATLNHPTVLRFIGATETAPYTIVTQWMPGGNLYRALHQQKINNTDLTIAAFDIARGMKYLHNNQIIHRDLKTLNILLDENNRIRICDFGFSKKVLKTNKKEIMTKNIGTPYWMAPEILLKDAALYDFKVDVYSYGIILWEMLTHEIPYKMKDPKKVIAEIVTNDIRPLIPKNTDQKMQKLITRCWDRLPENRPTFEEILNLIKSGEIIFPETDKKVVMDYIEKVQMEEDKDSIKIYEMLKKSEKEVTLSEFYSIISTNLMKSHLFEKCWHFFHHILYNQKDTPKGQSNATNNSEDEIEYSVYTTLSREDSELVARILSIFLQTSFAFQAAKSLKYLPRGTVPPDVITDFMDTLPTGSERLDGALIFVACKNNMAEEAVVHSFYSHQTQFALEALSRKKKEEINELFVEAVVARCNLSLASIDPEYNFFIQANKKKKPEKKIAKKTIFRKIIKNSNDSTNENENDNDNEDDDIDIDTLNNLAVSAIQCLISIEKEDRIPKTCIIRNLQSQCIKLKIATCLCITESILKKNTSLDINVIGALLSVHEREIDSLIVSVMKVAFRNMKSVTNFVDWIDDSGNIEKLSDDVLIALLMDLIDCNLVKESEDSVLRDKIKKIISVSHPKLEKYPLQLKKLEAF